MKLICKHCGKEFEAKIKQFRYCSHDCLKQHYKDERKLERKDVSAHNICQICGKPFMPKPKAQKAKYCSDDCKQIGQRLRRAYLSGMEKDLTKDEYIKSKLVVLDDMYIKRPSQDDLDALKTKSETAIDNWFRAYIDKAWGK